MLSDYRSRRYGNNKGVALLSVLIVVAMVSVTAAWLIRSQHVAIERTHQIIRQEQAMLHALSIEFVILDLLKQDKRDVDYYTTRNPVSRRKTEDGFLHPIDQNDELWSREWDISSRNFEEFSNLELLKNVNWSICMHDASGLANLNRLHRSLDAPGSNKEKWPLKKFINQFFLSLFTHADLGPEDDSATPTPRALLDSLLDWFDRDNDPRSDGAEDSEYLNKQPPYLPASGRMIWSEEIYLVHNFNNRSVTDFVDDIIVLPYLTGKLSGQQPRHKININTAPRSVLRALPGLDEKDDPDGLLVSNIMEYRKDYYESPFKKPGDLCQLISICDTDEQSFWKAGVYNKYLGVKSEFIQAATRVKAGSFEIELQNLIFFGKEPKVLQRRFGKGYYKQCMKAKRGIIKGRP